MLISTLDGRRAVAALLYAGCVVAVGAQSWTWDPVAWQMMTVAEIREYLDAGADVAAAGPDELTPLMYAAAFCADPAVLREIIQQGGEVAARDANLWTPLAHAAYTNPNPRISMALVEAGADYGERMPQGATPLMLAAIGNNAAVVEAFIAMGSKVHERDHYGNTAFLIASRYNPSVDVLRVLVEAGSTTTAVDGKEWTALMIAAEGNNPAVLDYLLGLGIDPNAVGIEGQTAMQIIQGNRYLSTTPAAIRLAWAAAGIAGW
jgi:ankyrin repeat protein